MASKRVNIKDGEEMSPKPKAIKMGEDHDKDLKDESMAGEQVLVPDSGEDESDLVDAPSWAMALWRKMGKVGKTVKDTAATAKDAKDAAIQASGDVANVKKEVNQI